MDIKWTDDGDGTLSARVGSVILLVTPRDGGVWTAQIKIKYGNVDDATFACREDAVRWCGRRLSEIVDPLVATARAEAALAEQGACVSALDAEIAALGALGDERDERGTTVVGWRIKSVRTARDAIRARTTPATLSTETLAAIAEARGLRVVEPGLLAGIEPPVLRWNEDHGTLHGAPWSLLLNETDFVVFLSRQIVLRREYADGTAGDVGSNRRAAEAALVWGRVQGRRGRCEVKRYEVDGDPDFSNPTTVQANSPEHAAEVYTHENYDDGWSDHWTAYVRSVDGDAVTAAGEVVHVDVFTQHALIVTTSCNRGRKDGAK